ncbi:protease-4 [Gulbenkiania mobilis]|uniref:Protease-4 n=1 Tax=Gulbenkiania mobilis TaxID=397457 RepID=A0ABY2D0H9_GULMO|nr:protease-4 [Gulbenkiania mobilis]
MAAVRPGRELNEPVGLAHCRQWSESVNDNPNWERDLVEKLAMAALVEQRRARRWRIFFRLVWLVFFLVLIASLWGGKRAAERLEGSGYTALINLNGEISTENDTAEMMIEALKDAYDDTGTKGIVIRANSPGGSPVLSGIVYDEMRRLKKLHPSVPVYVVVEEMCASGCYYIASAADRIYVDKASIVGSIGVLSDGFGLTGLMEKMGVERRLQTSGANKGMGDPFSPRNPRHEAIRQEMLDAIHAQFIQAVKNGRGNRLKDDPELFSGRVWIGEKSLPLGLADGYGSVESVARDVIKSSAIVDVTPSPALPDRFVRQFGVSFADGVQSFFKTRWY